MGVAVAGADVVPESQRRPGIAEVGRDVLDPPFFISSTNNPNIFSRAKTPRRKGQTWLKQCIEG
jgi:hypothetical protein